MKRALLTALVFVAALSVSGTAFASENVIYVVNTSTSVTDVEIQNSLAPYQKAIDRDFAPVWHATARLQFIGAPETPPAGGWTITITDEIDCMGCAGYHDETDGVPYAKIFPELGDWRITFPHEAFEMLANPDTSYPRGIHTRRGWYMVEVADPVEADELAYDVDGWPVSDFVHPSWYTGGKKPYDHAGLVKRIRQILPGGYQIVFRGGNWTSIGRHVPVRGFR